jgi:hypothetical protein
MAKNLFVIFLALKNPQETYPSHINRNQIAVLTGQICFFIIKLKSSQMRKINIQRSCSAYGAFCIADPVPFKRSPQGKQLIALITKSLLQGKQV